ncbi:MAG TPA: hypothetical protein VLH13_00975 [Methanomassiliicoccales archaeon]|nr:hypothetical protein [Methanomassiliicoccales archaeon]
MIEDTKLMSGAGSTGMELHLEPGEVQISVLRNGLSDFISAFAATLERQGALIGHVKLIAETDSGFIKMSVVDTELGVETIEETRGSIAHKGRVRVMAAVLNLTDLEVRQYPEESLEGLSRKVHLHEAGHHCHHED